MDILTVDKKYDKILVMDIDKYLYFIEDGLKEKFGLFKDILLEYNEKFNLTSLTEEKDIKYKHFLDSLAGESYFEKQSTVLEIGSGGGFPSIPLKILREDLSFTLIESTNKKCIYLKEVVDKMSLSEVRVINTRAEEAAKDINLREKFDAVCARAVARLNTLSEYCLPFLKVGGRFIAYKGEAEEEIKQAEKAIEILGGEIERVEKYSLPENSGERTLVIVRKIKKTPAVYPRGRGLERKKPII